MNYKPEALVPGKIYHIYNRGNNGTTIFFDIENYNYFLKLYQQYVDPIAETYSWCLLKNHIHALVYIKEPNEIKTETMHYTTVEKPRVIDASKQLSHLFNAYTQAINKRYHRTGSLFEKPFRRKCITSEKYLQNLIVYIHNNPVQHGFVETAVEHPWSSYGMLLSNEPSKLNRELMFSAFGSKQLFIDIHKQEQNLTKIAKFIFE